MTPRLRRTSKDGAPSVLIAGAGLAGLTAARELQANRIKVAVVEARNRVGGRVLTVREGFSCGQHAEAGGDLIDDGQNAIIDLAKALGLQLVPILKKRFGFVLSTQRDLAPPGVIRQVRSGRGSLEGPWSQLYTKLQPWLHAYHVSEERWDGVIARTLAQRSVADWLDEINADRKLRAFARGLRGFFLADPDVLSLLALVDQLAEGAPGKGKMYRIRGGNDQLTDRLARPIRREIEFQTKLVAVSQRPDCVIAALERPDGSVSSLAVDYLIIAIPASTLRKIPFDPALPRRQHEAIAELPYGEATKVLLQFDRAFWRRRGLPNAYGTDLPIGAVWDGNEQQPGKSGILSLLAGGTASAETQKLLRQHGTNAVVQALNWLQPRPSRRQAPARLLASHVTIWEEDPWSCGGYACFKTGYDPALRAWLSQPHGRILFAGEHTSCHWQGYMNGAVESGLRVATEVRALASESR